MKQMNFHFELSSVCLFLLGERIVVGCVIYVNSYSTWKGKSLWIEDIFVRPDSRGVIVLIDLTKILQISTHFTSDLL